MTTTYDVAMTDVDNTLVPEKNEGLYAECSMATLDNTYAALEKSELQQETEQVTLGNVQVTQPGEHKILGVRWDAAADRLIFDLADIAKLASSVELTKRNVTSTIGKVYDPLGFLAPVVIQFKVFFQEICEAKIDWDEPLPETLVRRWRSLVADLGERPANVYHTNLLRWQLRRSRDFPSLRVLWRINQSIWSRSVPGQENCH